MTDALGSTRGLVDSSEALTDSYTYTPYGKLSSHDGTSENSFLFTGEQLDSETEDYYLRARYYSPSSSRFLSRDSYDGTMNSPVTQNHYLYAGANPSMFVDPSGHMTLAGLGDAISIRGTLDGIARVRVPFNQLAVKRLVTEGIVENGQSMVTDLVINFVISKLTGFNPDLEDPRKGGVKHNAQTGGTAAHEKLRRISKELGSYHPFGKFVTLKAEVFLDANGNKPKEVGRRGAIGIDIEVWLENKLVVLIDLKTGKAGFTLDRAKDHSKRRGGNIPVIEVFIPFI